VIEIESCDRNNQVQLNGIIYKIYSIENEEAMRRIFLQCINGLVPYQCASFYLAQKNGNGKLSDPVGVNLTNEDLLNYFNYEDEDYRKWVFLSPKSEIFKESELYPEEKRNKTRIHRELHEPRSIYYCLQMSLVYDSTFLGVVSLYRNKDEGDYTAQEIFILDLLKDHLALRLSFEGKKHRTQHSKTMKIDEYIAKYQLTSRESEVLQLLFDGHSNDEISGELFISPNTLRKHLMHIYKKIGVSSRWELFK